jgi:hypothetical protein
VRERVAALSEAFARSPHDDPSPRYALFDIEESLRARGLTRELALIERLRSDRNAALRANLPEGAELWMPASMRASLPR